MEALLVLGKIFFAILFVDAGISHFRFKDQNVAYTRMKGIPLPELAVVSSGLVLVLAPIFFIMDLFVVQSLSLLAIFLATTCIFFHRYWKEINQQSRNLEKQAFQKNLALLGLVLVVISHIV